MEDGIVEICKNNTIENIDENSQRRKRRKTNYKKINNQTRQKLIEMV
jgi:hypothetical protein